LPLYPLAVESLNLSGYDLVISADGAATKGVITDQDSVHVCYCHSPARSYWDQYSVYRQEMSFPQRALFTVVSHYVRLWDFNAAQRIDGFIANSEYVADRVYKYYKRESTVIQPPVETAGSYISEGHDDYYLSVGRLVPAKKIDLLIAACNELGRQLKIVGTGPDEERLRGMAGPTVEFVGRVGDEKLREIYARCRAFLFAADEDFGIAPLEAQAFGRPVVAYGKGGSLETVVGLGGERSHKRPATGLFFEHQTVESLQEGICRFERAEFLFDPLQIRRHARKFETEVFVERMRTYVDSQIKRKRAGVRERQESPQAPEYVERT
jgi:glycosyltransferase involved in cell wall biosynthesis